MPENSLSRPSGRSRNKTLDTTDNSSFDRAALGEKPREVGSAAPTSSGAQALDTEFVRPFYNSYMPSDPMDPYLEPDD